MDENATKLPGSTPEGRPFEEPTTQGSSFEGMFVRTLQPTGKLEEELRLAGYDARAPKAVYPGRVWFDCLEVARRHAFPDLPKEEGLRELGRRFAKGFFETVVGKVMSVGLPVLGPVPVLKRLPRYWAMTRTGVTVTVAPVAERQWKVTFQDLYPCPDFIAGILDEGVGRTKVSPTIDIAARHTYGFDIAIRW